jgi:radical SAM protein with 4Fe4S-binding SPASM domain
MDSRDFTVDDSRKKMSLIIKPTEACNFSCDFCSSVDLVEDKTSKLELQKIFSFLKRFPLTERIFVVGGDPLMMKPSYYFDLLEHLEENNYPAIISMTTNLWDFYKRPEKWVELFKHPKIEIGTSFQYGEGRRISKSRVFEERDFISIYSLFKELVPGKDLCFLAVIDDRNEQFAIDQVYLAKRLGTQCRLVYSSKSGLAGRPYPISKLYNIFIKVWKLGLAEYEQTAITISDKLSGLEVACPLSRNCDHWMRSINPDGRYFTCGPLNDDLDIDNEIDFKSEVTEGKSFHLPLQNSSNNQYLKDECLSCPMFQVCNACRKHVKDLKSSDMVEEHCTMMKNISSDLQEMTKSSDILQLKESLS